MPDNRMLACKPFSELQNYWQAFPKIYSRFPLSTDLFRGNHAYQQKNGQADWLTISFQYLKENITTRK